MSGQIEPKKFHFKGMWGRDSVCGYASNFVIVPIRRRTMGVLLKDFLSPEPETRAAVPFILPHSYSFIHSHNSTHFDFGSKPGPKASPLFTLAIDINYIGSNIFRSVSPSPHLAYAFLLIIRIHFGGELNSAWGTHVGYGTMSATNNCSEWRGGGELILAAG